ncbi:hypothetical protein PISMIDRAFT_684645 [Pisolithus microcarpus 441]|uniref:Uncharacterized protein n=1 Tax=Pisolithus microcarpus 441 TaxID=765257 RepID=A0A0C9YVS2_9AGAM|nr:hypothetical protein PISMIDRAFT_684645 [Pisolithus microcarpus 441]
MKTLPLRVVAENMTSQSVSDATVALVPSGVARSAPSLLKVTTLYRVLRDILHHEKVD